MILATILICAHFENPCRADHATQAIPIEGVVYQTMGQCQMGAMMAAPFVFRPGQGSFSITCGKEHVELGVGI